MSHQKQNPYPQNPHNPQSFGPHGNFCFQPNQNNYQYPVKQKEAFNQQQMDYPPQGNFYPNESNFPQQGFNQPQYQMPEPEPAHEHPLNFEDRINDNCKICLINIGEKGGYKCKDCPLFLCLDCSGKIFYGIKKKQIHPHDLLLQPKISWNCDICKTSYMDKASFSCQSCNFNVCDKCYLEPNFSEPQYQPPIYQYEQPPLQQPIPPPNIQDPYPQQNIQQPYPKKPFQQPEPYQQPPFQVPQGQYQPNQSAYPQQQGGYQPQEGYYPQQNVNYNPQEYYQPQGGYPQQYQEQELNPESEHEHPLNFEEELTEKCKICLKQINGSGYKCKECPIVLCLDCSDRIFYWNKKKSLHQHELFLRDRISWKCNICKKSKRGIASFNCKECDFDVCEECFIEMPLQEQGQQEYQIPLQGYHQCKIPQNNPPLVIPPGFIPTQEQENAETFHDHPLNYEEKLNNTCHVCEQKIGGKEGYKCKECSLILCLNCYNKISYGTKKKSLHKHDLILQKRNKWKCNKCKKKKGNASFYCKKCDFDVCIDCFIEKSDQGTNYNYQTNAQYQKENPIGTEISAHEHPLNYLEKIKEICNLCLKKINNEKGFGCKTCKFVLCFDCSNKAFYKNKDKSIHKHDLFLRNKPSWKCDICKSSFKNKASYNCKQCDFDSCDNCYLKN